MTYGTDQLELRLILIEEINVSHLSYAGNAVTQEMSRIVALRDVLLSPTCGQRSSKKRVQEPSPFIISLTFTWSSWRTVIIAISFETHSAC